MERLYFSCWIELTKNFLGFFYSGLLLNNNNNNNNKFIFIKRIFPICK